MKELCTTALCVLCSGIVLASPGQEEEAPLWRIGLDDDSTAELAHAPGNYQAYRRPAFFVVGVSDPATDWPYVQPGTIDGGWAPGTPQTFEVHFGLEALSESGPCQLTLDFVDTHSIDPPRLRVEVNGARVAEVDTPRGAGDASVFGQPSLGREHVEVVEFPSRRLRAGNNIVSVTTVEGSWVLWDHLTLEAPAGARLCAVDEETALWNVFTAPVLKRRGEELVQPATIELRHLGGPCTGTLTVEGEAPVQVELHTGTNAFETAFARAEEARQVEVRFEREGTYPIRSSFELQPARDWEIHLVHQTHLDIGFTHTQEEVLQIQLEHLRTALDLIDETRDYPEEARFRWHPEGMWAVEEFMRTADETERERFVAACRDKLIHIDALYAQAMTGMYTEEGLFELVGAAKRFGQEHGIEVVSAMQSDVPGYTWGLASALSHNGIRYLAIHSRKDMSQYFQVNQPRNPDMWRVMANLYHYATDKGVLRARLDMHYEVRRADIEAGSSIAVARARYDGNWDPEPAAWDCQANFMHNRCRTRVTVETVELDQLHTAKAPFAHVTGTAAAEFTDAQVAAIQQFVDGGGVILFDAAGGKAAFAESVQEMLRQRAFPGHRMRPIPVDHPVIRGVGVMSAFDCSTVDYQPYALLRMGKTSQPRLIGLEVKGEPRVVLSYEDMTTALLDQPVWGVFGYSGDSARRLTANLALWAAQPAVPTTQPVPTSQPTTQPAPASQPTPAPASNAPPIAQ